MIKKTKLLIAAFILAIIGGKTPCCLSEPLVDPLFSRLNNYDSVLVEKIFSTDSFVLEGGEKVRLIGLKGAEVPKKMFLDEKRQKIKRPINTLFSSPIIVPKREIDPKTPIDVRAYQFTKDLLLGEHIRLEFDVQTKDKDFFTLAYAFLPDGTFVNEAILKEGFAHLKTIPPNTKYKEILRTAYQHARKEKKGLQGE